MRGKRVDKTNNCKILQGQSQKIKQKLELLKQQIKIKKQEKLMSATSTTMGRIHQPVTSKMNQTNYSQKGERPLYAALSQLKIQNIEQKLKDKDIFDIEQLYRVGEQEIDNWKDIPVGYRIKLKKYIEKNRGKQVPPLHIQQLNQPQDEQPVERKSRDIEQIIKYRNTDKLYRPIDRQEEDVQEDQRPQLTQFEQQKMMLSILSFLGGKERSSTIKSKTSQRSTERKHVHWSKDVQQLESMGHEQKKYPKEIISKKVFNEKMEHMESPAKRVEKWQQLPKERKTVQVQSEMVKEYPDYKYCWGCLKKLNSSFDQIKEKFFCSSLCSYKYEETVNPIEVLSKCEQVEQAYYAVLQNREETGQEEGLDLDIL